MPGGEVGVPSPYASTGDWPLPSLRSPTPTHTDAIADTYVAREAARAGARRAGPTSVTDLNTHERSDAVRSRGVDLNSPLILHPSCSDLAAIAQRPCVAQHSCF